MRWLAVLVLALLAAGPGFAQGFADRPEYRVLARATCFAGEAVGSDGDCPEAVVALRLIVQSADGRDALLDLLDRATRVGQLYALCGLWELDPEAFRARVDAYVEREERIDFQLGCTVSRARVRDVVRSDAPLTLRLRGPGDTIARWRAEHDLPAEVEPRRDIVGGGFPVAFGLRRPFGGRSGLEGLPAGRRRLGFWVEQLCLPEPARADTALHPIEAIARFGREALPVLRPLIRHPSPAVRRDVAELLGQWLGVERLGHEATECVALLTRMLGDADPEVEREVAVSLRFHDAWAVGALEAVVARIAAAPAVYVDDDRDAETPSILIAVLARLGPPAVPRLVALLRHANSLIREQAALELAGAGSTRDVPDLLPLLADPERFVRRAGLVAVRRLRADAPDVVTALRAQLSDGDTELARLAARALGEVRGEAVPSALQALEAVPATSGPLRLELAVACWKLGGPDQGLAELILEHESDPAARGVEREDLRLALVEVARREPQALDALVAALSRPDRAPVALAALAALGPAGGAAAGALRRIATDAESSSDRRLEAARALMAVSGEAELVVELIASGLGERDPSLSRRAAHQLAELGQSAAPAVARLASALGSSDEGLRGAALAALEAIGQAAGPAVPVLLGLLERRCSDGERAAIAGCLGRIGGGSPAARAALERLTSDPAGRVRTTACEALATLGR